MLQTDKRKELDTIVQDMINHKESDFNIKFVVDDFKKKYDVPVDKPKTSVMEKAGKVLGTVFGGEKIGEAIGSGVAKLGLTGLNEQERKNVSMPSAASVAGDVVGVGLTLAGLKGVSTAGTFGARLLKSIGLGAGLAGSQAIKEEKGIQDVAKSTVIGGAVGGAIPVVGAGLSAIGNQIKQLPSRFINSALSRSKAQVLQDISKDKVDDFSNYVLKSKPIGSANKLLGESYSQITKLNNQVNESLSSAIRKSGDKTTIGVSNFIDQIAKIPEAEGALLKRADIKQIVEKLAPQTKQLLQKSSLTVAEANKLRQLVDKTLGDRAFLGGQLSSDKIILKKFADNLREVVKTKAPEGTRELFAELTNEIRFRDGLLEKVAQKAGNQVLSFGDFIGGGLGGVFGGGIPGAVAGVAARRVIESVPFKLSAAKLTNAITKIGPTLEELTPAQQTAIMGLFAEILSPDEKPVEQPSATD